MTRTYLMLLIACAVALAFPAVAFANSSWWWTWESLLKPSDLFPIAVAATIIGANVVTTALVAIIEQTLCFGTMHGF